MIVYKNSKAKFLSDTENFSIEDIIQACVQNTLNIHKSTESSEYKSWRNSLQFMANLLRAKSIPEDAGVAIEYNIIQSRKRIDFILAGQDENGIEHVILIELKQWDAVESTNKDAIVKTRFAKGMTDTVHPSYQAWSYSSLLEGFNETIYKENIQLKPCSYLHNYTDDGVISDKFYDKWINKAPLFFKEDREKLRDFIGSFIKYGDRTDIILRIENGRISPSKALADNIASMLKGNAEFVMIDEQKLILEEAFSISASSSKTDKNVLIINGGPGTGKSVVAINLLAKLSKAALFGIYVSKNSAPRIVYESRLTGSMNKSAISNFFTGSGAFVESQDNQYDVLIVDEAHRLTAKSGMYNNLGENQIKELIKASKCTVFFLDENQRVTLSDIGSQTEITKWATKYNAKVTTMELTSQFRCCGSDGYIAWLDHILQIKDTANLSFDGQGYDFRIFDNPNKLRDAIFEKNKMRNKARLVAGYCWDWKGKNDPAIMDIVIAEHQFNMKWNLGSDGMMWIVNPLSVNEVGCIHTCQGLEVDYIGVIIGPDLIVRNDIVLADATQHPTRDRAVFGHKKMMKENPELATPILTSIIKNTYRTLMSRGMKGCYVYFIDKETESYFRSFSIKS